MASARIAPLEPPYPAAIQADFDRLMRGAPPLALFRTVARNPRVLARMMAGGLLDRGSIALRLRELMILRTTALCGAEYEWGVHVAVFGAQAGWRAEELSRTVHGTSDGAGWSEEEALVVRLAESLHRSADVDDELWAALAARFGAEQLIELVMLAGLYHAVSFMVNATRVAHEPEAPRFP
jgi:alkylhydroperoxidase family enzyme